MEEELTPSDGGEVRPVSPICRVGDSVVFKYEGNVRATVEGYELVGGRVRLRCRAETTTGGRALATCRRRAGATAPGATGRRRPRPEWPESARQIPPSLTGPA